VPQEETKRDIYKKNLLQTRLSLAGLEYQLERSKLQPTQKSDLIKAIYLIKTTVFELEKKLDEAKSDDDLLRWQILTNYTITSLISSKEIPEPMKTILKSLLIER